MIRSSVIIPGPERGLSFAMRDFYTKENMRGEDFHVPGAGLLFEPGELSFEAETETGREGVIRVRHLDGKPARGYVYPSERCMRGVREQFAPAADGTGQIRWHFDARGIAPGRTVRGLFRVITPYGEYCIPYTVQVLGKGELQRKKGGGAGAAVRAGAFGRAGSGDAAVRGREAYGKPSGDAAVRRDTAQKGGSPDLSLRAEDVRSLEDFRAFSEQDYRAAADLFYSGQFEQILTREEDKTLYRGLSMKAGNLQNVEEFLIAACGKEKTVYEPVEKTLFLEVRGRAGRTDGRLAGNRAARALEAHRQRVRNSGLGGTQTQNVPSGTQEDLVYLPLHIRKTGAGQIGPVIRTGGRFLPTAPFAVPAENIPEGEEGGFTVRIPVDCAALHAGRNFGSVLVYGPFQEAAVPVEVHCMTGASSLQRRRGRELQLLELQLMRLYVDYRLTDDPEGSGDWFRQADHLIDEILLRSYGELRPRLYGVHLLLLRGQYAEAERALGRIVVRYAGTDAPQGSTARFQGESEDTFCYRQYLYAKSRTEDVQLRSRVVRFLRGVYRQTGDWRTAWMLMDLSEEYAPGTAARWNFLRHQFENGCSSPFILLEAWEMVRLDPRILLPGSSVQERWAKDEFGLHVLWYAARNHALTAGAAQVMVMLAEKKKTFSPLLYKGLGAAYDMELFRTKKVPEPQAGEGFPAKSGTGSGEQAGTAAQTGEGAGNPVQTPQTGAGARSPAEALPQMEQELLRAICILLVRGQDLSPKAHRWYARAVEAGVFLTKLEENWRQSMPVDDAAYRLPAGCNAVLRTTAARAVRAVLLYDRFRTMDVFPVRGGVAFMPVYGDANTVFLEDAEGNRYAKSLPYALDVQREESSAAAGPKDPRAMAADLGYGNREASGFTLSPRTAAEAADLLDSGLLTAPARTELLLDCLSAGAGQEEYMRLFLSKADPSRCSAKDRARLLGYLAEAGEYETALGWLTKYGEDGVDAQLLGRICLGLSREGRDLSTILSAAWEAFLRGNTQQRLLQLLAENFTGVSGELLRLREACAQTGAPVEALDRRIIRQVLFSGEVMQGHAQIIVQAGKKLGEVFLPAAAQYADYAFSGGIMMGGRMTDLLTGILADGGEGSGKIHDICRIAYLKELSMRQGEIGAREKSAAKESLSVLLSKGIIFPFYRQFPGLDDRLDLYAEETLVQYHPSLPSRSLEDRPAKVRPTGPDDGRRGVRTPAEPAGEKTVSLNSGAASGKPAAAGSEGERHIVFHYTTSRRGEIGNYRARPMKEMYRDFFVSGFLLFYGEQMHYYITDDRAEKHVVQSGMIGQDARILENCSGRFGLINETTRAAALRQYDEALSLLTGYYRRSYLENELFRR